MTIKNISTFTSQKYSSMRYLIIISFTILFAGCGQKLDSLKYAGEKVAQTVEACTGAVTNACNENINASSVSNEYNNTGGEETKASAGWDMRMMLW